MDPPTDEVMSLDIDLAQVESNEEVVVTTSDLIGPFLTRTYRLKSGQSFSIGSMKGPNFWHVTESIDTKNLVSVSYVYFDGDGKALVLILEYANGTKLYYNRFSRYSSRWEQISDMTGDEDLEKIMLPKLKEIFRSFFSSKVKISEKILLRKSYTFRHVTFLISEILDYCEGYDSYCFEPDTAHSVSTISLDNTKLKFPNDLSFVKILCFYYANDDITTPLLLETLDYKFGSETPLYNYYKPEHMYSKNWLTVESGAKLENPKADSDLKRILDQILFENHEKEFEVILKVSPKTYLETKMTRFEGVPFIEHGSLSYGHFYRSISPKLNDSFLVKILLINDNVQKIDLKSIRLKSLFVFFTEKNLVPVLICIKKHTHGSGSGMYDWYKQKELSGTEWERLDFDADPVKDRVKIENQIKNLHETSIFGPDTLKSPLFWFTVVLGLVIAVIFGILFSRKLVNLMRRAVVYIRGLFG
uniref:Uncharacterized protein n=1 Tax=Theileria annulata TaxID=5874 RepID=A0A3B0MWQ7_THEAN